MQYTFNSASSCRSEFETSLTSCIVSYENEEEAHKRLLQCADLLKDNERHPYPQLNVNIYNLVLYFISRLIQECSAGYGRGSRHSAKCSKLLLGSQFCNLKNACGRNQ